MNKVPKNMRERIFVFSTLIESLKNENYYVSLIPLKNKETVV
jgi:hypothetical protein